MKAATILLLFLIAIAIAAFAGYDIDMPKIKLNGPAFLRPYNTVLMSYKEQYKAKSVSLGWETYTGDTDQKGTIKVQIGNSSMFSFDQQSELVEAGKPVARDIAALLSDRTTFSTIEVVWVWNRSIISRTFTAKYPLEPTTPATPNQSESTSATATTR